ncbi:hypothetical protein E0K83_04210 [Gramella sp. BOM4]|nr:hypothetical protein [Christiangramia bathymodioli]
MRTSVAPARSFERDFKFAVMQFFLKLLFIAGIAFLVYKITSKTYVLPPEVQPKVNILQVVDSAPPIPF